MAPFSFVVFGDIQNHNSVAKHMIELAASQRPDLCVVVGDLVNDGTDLALWEECTSLLEPLGTVCEVVAIPGNHDYEAPGVAATFCRFLRAPGEPTYLSLGRGGCRFLLLDTVLHSGEPWEGGSMPSDSTQLGWLRSELQAAREHAEPCFVFGHHPVFMPAQIYRCTSPTIRVDEAGDTIAVGNLLPVLLEGRAHTFFAGHLHLYERSRYRGMNFVTSGASGFEFPNLGEGGNTFSISRHDRHHLCRAELSGDTVRFRAIDESSEVIDEWEEPCQPARDGDSCRAIEAGL